MSKHIMTETGQPLMILNDRVLVGDRQFQQLYLETTIAKKRFFIFYARSKYLNLRVPS